MKRCSCQVPFWLSNSRKELMMSVVMGRTAQGHVCWHQSVRITLSESELAHTVKTKSEPSKMFTCRNSWFSIGVSCVLARLLIITLWGQSGYSSHYVSTQNPPNTWVTTLRMEFSEHANSVPLILLYNSDSNRMGDFHLVRDCVEMEKNLHAQMRLLLMINAFSWEVVKVCSLKAPAHSNSWLPPAVEKLTSYVRGDGSEICQRQTRSKVETIWTLSSTA